MPVIIFLNFIVCGKAIFRGVAIKGYPVGLPVFLETLYQELNRMSPGQWISSFTVGWRFFISIMLKIKIGTEFVSD